MNALFSKLKSTLSHLVEIRPQERMKTFVMFFYFFSIIATVWMLKPVRNSLFLDELGAKNLRYVYMGEGLFLILIVWLFINFAKRVSKKTLYNGVLIFFITCLIGFWGLFRTDIPYLSAFFYVWAATYSIIMTTQFFTLANDIFNPIEAKRLFGFILSGGSIGGVLGGILTNQLVGGIGTENLLLVIAAVIGICNTLVMTQWKHLVPTGSKEETLAEVNKREKEEMAKNNHLSGRKLVMGSSYLMMLACLVMIVKLTSAVVDNQFNAMVEISVVGKDARTAFYGGFFSFLNGLSFLMQLFATSLILRYLGVGIALWILPMGLLLGGAGTIVYPVLMTAIFLKAFDGSANYSIQQATREVLYLPIASEVRYRVKPVIDMLGYRIAKSLGGVYIAVFAPLFGLADERLSVLVFCLLPIWFFVVWKMRKAYSEMLRSNLMDEDKKDSAAEPKRATDVLGALYGEKTMESMSSYINHESSYARKISSAAYLLYLSEGKNFETARERVMKIARREAYGELVDSEKGAQKDSDIEELEDLFMKHAGENYNEGVPIKESLREISEELLIKLGSILASSEKGLDSKRKAVGFLELIPRQEAMDLLTNNLSHAHDQAFRFIIIKALNRLHDQNPKLEVNRFLIKNEIARETRTYEKIKLIRQFYKKQAVQVDGKDYLKVTLKAIQEESFERVFHLLDLLYPHEIIQIIYNRIRSHSEHDKIRAHAIELLNNTLNPDLLGLIQKILDDREIKNIREKDVVDALDGFMRSQDQWFCLTSFFIVSDLSLDKRWPKLESALKTLKF